MAAATRRAASTGALLATAAVAGAVAGAMAAGFIWLVEGAVHLVWSTIPGWLDLDPFASWWLVAILVLGGLLVGLGQKYVGDYPVPLETNLQLWRNGGRVDPRTLPPTLAASLVNLGMGGPLGFEAALTGIVGACATWVGDRIRSVGTWVREAWGAQRIDGLPTQVRRLPYYLSGVSGLLVYRWLPFGQIDMGFRFTPELEHLGIRDAAVAFGFALVVAVPAAWAAAVVHRAEAATLYRRAPVLAGIAGGLAVAALAAGNQFVLFSGQESLQHLVTLGTGSLVFLAVAKWVALSVALLTGWRGGPIFPLFLAVSALAVACASLLGVDPTILMIAGITTVSLTLLRGNITAAFVLSLYVVPLAFTELMLIGVVGAALGYGLAGAAGLLPATGRRGIGAGARPA